MYKLQKANFDQEINTAVSSLSSLTRQSYFIAGDFAGTFPRTIKDIIHNVPIKFTKFCVRL